MKNEKVFKSPKIVAYKLKINIEIKGKAPEPKNKEEDGKFPYLPISFLKYIQDLATTYERYYKEEGFFIIVSLRKEEIMV